MPLKSVPTRKVRIAEDCAGLGTGSCTFKRSAHKLNRQSTKAAANNSQYRPLRRRKIQLPKKIQIDPVYMSENDPPLRRFLRHKWPQSKIVEDSNLGSDSRGDTLLGKDGDIDVYIAGGSCQPFSKQGKNGGRKDRRSNTTRDSVDFIKERRPKCFIIEQVKNILSKTHKKWLRHRILRVIKHLKRKDGRKLYKVRMEIYNSERFNSPQIRKRVYITGVRTDVACLRKFKMPTGRSMGCRPKSLASLVASSMSGPQVDDCELSNTERRNWIGIKNTLNDRTDVKYPVIGDFQQSKAFGISWQERKSPTITKARAGQRAFWIIDKLKDGLGFSKRRLEVRDYAQLMGWDNKSQTQYLGIDKQFHCSRNPMAPLPARLKGDTLPQLSQSQLLAALGNSFSVPVFQAIAENMLKCFNGQKVKSDSEDSDSDSGGPTRSVNGVSVGQCEHFRCTPVKKQKLSQDRKINSFEAAIDQQTALERDAKCQRGFKYTK
jgi:DNA-cytosine methyltransferase